MYGKALPMPPSAGIPAAPPLPPPKASPEAQRARRASGPLDKGPEMALLLNGAQHGAKAKLVELLKHPDDLSGARMRELRHKYGAEQASHTAQLQTAVQQELNDSQESIFLMNRSAASLEEIKARLRSVEHNCEEAKDVIGNYPKIKRVATLHSHFVTTKAMVLQFQTLTATIERLRALLQADAASPRRDGAPSLLKVHANLHELEGFRDETLALGANGGKAVAGTLTAYFRRLDSLAEQFRRFLWELARSLLDLVRDNQGSLVVRLATVLEFEEAADARCARLAASTTSSNVRPPRAFRAQFFDAVYKSIEEAFQSRFAAVYKEAAANKEARPKGGPPPTYADVSGLLQAADFVFDDLGLVQWELAPRLPPHYNVFNVYAVEYHKHVHALVQALLQRRPELAAKDVLVLTRWCASYYARLERQLHVAPELLEPPVLDGGAVARLHESYLRALRAKLGDWIAAMVATEARELTERAREPDRDAEGLYGTGSDVILFQMVTQQLDVVGGHAALLPPIAAECLRLLHKFCDDVGAALQAQLAHLLAGGTARDRPAEGLEAWALAIANNAARCSEFAETLGERLQRDLASAAGEGGEIEHGEISSAALSLAPAVERVGARFLELARSASGVVLDVLARDVRPVFAAQLFTPAWYDSPGDDPIHLVLATCEDYLADARAHLLDYLFGKLVVELADRLCLMYCEALRGKSARLRAAQLPDRMRTHIALFEAFFARFKRTKRIDRALDALHKVLEILLASKAFLFLGIYGMWKVYPDTPPQFVEDLLWRRDDLDKPAIRDAMEQWRRKIKETQESPESGADLGERGATFVHRL